MTTLSIIIPVHNEEKTIGEIVKQIYAVDFGNIEREVIVSNDGSTDETTQIINQLKTQYLNLVTYHSPTNLGKGAAVRLGIAISSGDMITIQDADMELNPNEYPRFLDRLLNQNTKIVYGSRFLNSKVKLNRPPFLANRFLTFLTNLVLWISSYGYGNSL